MPYERLTPLTESVTRDLTRIARIVFEEFEDSQKLSHSERRKSGRILKMILVGAHAAGWVDSGDPSAEVPDYELLIVVNSETFAENHECWNVIADRLTREATVTRQLRANVSLMIHSLMDINDQLARGRPFFVELLRKGILLHATPGYPLAEPKPLTAEAATAEARRAFDYWFASATRFQRLAALAVDHGLVEEAAFLLHQTAERLYHCALNVATLSSPKSHRLSLLRTRAERVAPDLAAVWPEGTTFEKRCFRRLDRAYVEARYSPGYEIDGTELVWLSLRIDALRQAVARLCEQRLGALPSPSRPDSMPSAPVDALADGIERYFSASDRSSDSGEGPDDP